MRELLQGDVAAAARVLLALPEAARAPALKRMLAEAEIADRYRRHVGRAHWLYGDGSLRAAAMRHAMPAEPLLSDPDYLDCLARVIAALSERRSRGPVFSSRRSFRVKSSAYLV